MNPAGPNQAVVRPPSMHQGGFVRLTLGIRPLSAVLGTLVGLIGLAGCHKSGPTAGTIMVSNIYRGTCSEAHGKATVIRANLDNGPAVVVADGAKFEFANIAMGTHTLGITSTGASMEQGDHPWLCQILVAGGVAYTVTITCGSNGTVSPSCP
jgi:hypothetical protein